MQKKNRKTSANNLKLAFKYAVPKTVSIYIYLGDLFINTCSKNISGARVSVIHAAIRST